MNTVKKLTIKKGFGKAIITNEIKSHANDPFVLEKNEKAKLFFQKHPLPSQFKRK